MEQAMAELTFEARRLYQDALQQAGRDRGQGSTGDHGKGGGDPRERSLYDPRDCKLADLPNEPSLAAFKKWRHDLELFLETIGTSWKGVTALMRTSRIFTETFASITLREVELLRKKTEPAAPDLDATFGFHEKADALYKLLMPKLSVSLPTELRQVGTPNGFQFFRQLTQKLDPPRAPATST